jgi:hypothetical protein
MAKIWRNRLIDGTQKYSDCPEKYKAQVLALLRADVESGVISEERYLQIISE